MYHRRIVSPIVPLAFALHSNRGAYAVLPGSGVSEAAGIPTGQQVVADLLTKIARLEGENVGDDAGGWYCGRFGEAPPPCRSAQSRYLCSRTRCPGAGQP